MEYRVAPSYENYERVGEPFDRNGKKYTKVQMKCDRCIDGVFVSRIENGRPVPHPAYGGVCLKCNGTGFLTKTVRLYTENQYKSMARAKEKRNAEREEKMRLALAQANLRWFNFNGFSADGTTYIVYGNSYPIKEDLKSHGYKYSKILGWHGTEEVEVPEDCGIQLINFSDVYEWKSPGNPDVTEEGQKFMDEIFSRTFTESEWVGEVGERLHNLEAVLVAVGTCNSRWGLSAYYVFKSDGNLFVWFTQKSLNLDKGAKVDLTGTVKSHKVYRGNRTTYLNRCIVK